VNRILVYGTPNSQRSLYSRAERSLQRRVATHKGFAENG
jgi:hypothetical protein